MFLRQSTASQEILLGPFLDDTDGKTAETALSIANTDIKLWKHGATAEADKNSGGATHIAGGRYYTVLDATDSNTLGLLELNVHIAGALPVRRAYLVLPANVYDSLVLGSDLLDVSSVQLAGQAITASAGVTFPSSVASPTNITAGTITTVSGNVNGTVASVVGSVGSVTGAVGSVTGNVGGNVVGSVGSVTTVSSGAITAASIATNAVDADALATDAVTEIVTAIWGHALAELTSIPTITTDTKTALAWIFTLGRNKITQDATEQALYRDDGSTKLAEADVSQVAGTFTRGEFRTPT